MTINKNSTRSVFINQAFSHFDSHPYKKPLIIIDDSGATATYFDYLTQNQSVHPHTVLVDPSTDRKSLIQSLLNALILEEYDVIYTMGGQLAFTYGQELLYLIQHLQQAFTYESYIPEFKSLFVLTSSTTQAITHIKRPYRFFLPDQLFIEHPVKIHDSTNFSLDLALSTLHHATDQFLFCHMNTRSSQITQECIELIYKHIITAYKRNNAEAITYINSAIYLTDILFDCSPIGLSHKINAAIQSKFHISSQLNYLLLPHTLLFLCQNYDFKRQLSTLACYLTLDFNDISTNVTAFIESLKMMNNALDLPMTISTHGIENKVFLDHIDELSQTALDAINTLDYNLTLTIEDIRGILVNIM